ncbi:restriction endonuclease [Nonomuraea jiangxiensis]|uniref:restriction endonuclease n=1 Tax=Nonomuraea jiangxiensis TaxID=633440 RepID=UPI000B838E56|nr:restriction endonuclease [Nonomuraea jiangxiensis]
MDLSSDLTTPDEFEEFVQRTFQSMIPAIEDLRVTLHEIIRGVDGTYDFDVTVRYQLFGLSFLVLAEAKRHLNPIKRELVQILHQKQQSVGAHKAVMFSTAPYQSGAVSFAQTHGIALILVSKTSLVFKSRSQHDYVFPYLPQPSCIDACLWDGYILDEAERTNTPSGVYISQLDALQLSEKLLGLTRNQS